MEYEQLRQLHVSEAYAQVPAHIERLGWSRTQIMAERTERLRELVRVAVDRSTWHRSRLRGLECDSLTEAHLKDIPSMTKADLMGNFDDIVTDARLSQELVEKHLASMSHDGYLLDEFHTFASGGSSGERGIFVYGWDAWTQAFLAAARRTISDMMRDPWRADRPSVMGLISGESPTHMMSALGQTFSSPTISIGHFPVNMPLGDIVEGLNALAPTDLAGYPSILKQLAAEADLGKLKIEPHRIISSAEPLFPETREILESVFKVPVSNQYSSSETGPLAVGCFQGRGMHLNEDLVIVEPMDESGEPVQPGEQAAKLFVTNLTNTTLPLIRYELTDRVVVMDEPCPCGSQFQRIDDVQGRIEDLFDYEGELKIHPVVFSALSREPNVAEYQVRQTSKGAEIHVVTTTVVDAAQLSSSVEQALKGAGLTEPEVTIVQVPSIERHGIGKLKRFVRL